MRYIARIDPQVWVDDDAMSVDPPGEDTWDCSEFVANPPEWCRDYFREIDSEISNRGEFFDRDDVLRRDPAAPSWVGDWDSPFTITVEIES